MSSRAKPRARSENRMVPIRAQLALYSGVPDARSSSHPEHGVGRQCEVFGIFPDAAALRLVRSGEQSGKRLARRLYGRKLGFCLVPMKKAHKKARTLGGGRLRRTRQGIPH